MASSGCNAKLLLSKQASHYDSELKAAKDIYISIDLVVCAGRYLSFLKIISGLPLLHGQDPLIRKAIRRYWNLWMPLAAKHDAELLPPLDVEWVWTCHCLNSVSYREFCKLHYAKVINTPFSLDMQAQMAARDMCKSLWSKSYPNEPFDLDLTSPPCTDNQANQKFQTHHPSQAEENALIDIIVCQSSFYSQVSQPYMFDSKFMRVSKERYQCFLYMSCKSQGQILIPTSDIQLMWQSHKVSPLAYAWDTEAYLLEDYDLINQGRLNDLLPDAFENTKRTWETLFGHPYERAGVIWRKANNIGTIISLDTISEGIPATISWNYQDVDVNAKLETLDPRHVLEVCIQIRNTAIKDMETKDDSLIMYLQLMKACGSWKLHVPIQKYRQDTVWHRVWLMQCEVHSEGLILELRSRIRGCIGFLYHSRLLGQATLQWADLENKPLLALDTFFQSKKHISILDFWMIDVSITPPVQAPYLLKSFPDHVTDDDGAMISSKIYQRNNYRPQEGRWMSRIVLNHSGKECFIIRIRVASGIWKSKSERPIGVDWDDRIIHIHLGGWEYISSSIGIASGRILATATPFADELEQYKMKWSFSTGEMLMVQMPIENLDWERHLRFSVKGTLNGVVRLLNGRHMQYQVPSAVPEEEEGFVTLVRYTTESRQGRATALFNWRLSAMEVVPEEDVVFVMLICIATQRTVADLGGRTVRSNLYRRKQERKARGKMDWGVMVMGEGCDVPSGLMFWHLNPEEVLGMEISENDFEGVLPNGSSDHMYRGTSWLYSGGSGGLYNVSSKGSWDSIDHPFHFGSLRWFGSQHKGPHNRS